MTDEDVVERATRILDGTTTYRNPIRPGLKRVYSVRVSGARAAGWMMTLYVLMGRRRQAKIRDVLAEWCKTPTNAGAIATVRTHSGRHLRV